jgi:hypothetical protein
MPFSLNDFFPANTERLTKSELKMMNKLLEAFHGKMQLLQQSEHDAN